MRKILLIGLLLFAGCSEQKKKEISDETFFVLKKLEGKTIVKTQNDQNKSIILVTDDNQIVTFYGYRLDSGQIISQSVGARSDD